jgi:hypothetical protein
VRDADMARLLTIAAAIDHRDLSGVAGKAAVAAWMQAIGDLEYEECVEALGMHRRSSTEYLQPAHVARLVFDVVRPERAAAVAAAADFEADVRMVEALGGSRGEWERASALGAGHEQDLLERLAERRRAVEA